MKLTLNVGCGDRVYDFYPTPEYKCINFDFRSDLKRIDEVGDVRDLSRFPDGHFDYMLASDIIEHFPIAETNKILTEWKRVIIIGGVVEFRLPNLEAIAEDYVNRKNENRNNMKDMPIAHYFSWLLYGGQDYPGNFHYVGFDKRFFHKVCSDAGLETIDWKKDGYNMIIKCRKV
jgi:predicted SAM-dependent methyltransferase